MHKLLRACIVCTLLLIVAVPVRAQIDAEPAFSIFAENDVDPTGLDRIIFVNLRSGEEVAIEVYGAQYTVIQDGVLYFDYARSRVRLASPNGTVIDHPFIQMRPESTRIDWTISEDETLIAWTLTSLDPQQRLQTTTFVGNMDGTAIREVLNDLDTNARVLRAMPIAFSPDNLFLYMDYQPDRVSEFTPFKLYARLFALNLETGDVEFLPDEEGRCLCGADLAKGLFLRLRLTEDLQAFELHVYNLMGEIDTPLPALRLNASYDTGGDVLISPDGTKAVYALSQVTDFGLASQSIRTVFVLVDLNQMTHEPLTAPIRSFVIPTAWTEDNSALILTSPTQNGTWKINLTDGRLERIADATYVGSSS